jgi:type IV pilus assembly protein PilB
MFESHSEAIYELLRAETRVDQDRLVELWQESRAAGSPLADAVIESGLLPRQALLNNIAGHLGVPCVADPPVAVSRDVVGLVPASLARTHRVMPFREAGLRIELLAKDPFDGELVSELTFALNREVRLLVCDPVCVERLIQGHYGVDESGLEVERCERVSATAPDTGQDVSAHDLEVMAGQMPVVRLVNLVIAQAIRDHASDIHFEPFEGEFKIRQRIDGVLHEMTPPPKVLALPITSRIKVLANLNIAERRVPQDGRIKVTIAGRAVDLRVSTLPTQFGESVVLRVLDQSAVQLHLTELGLPADVLPAVQSVIRRPNGIFLVTGPTGSGKTTTLYSGLRAINAPEVKVLTIEDPVEYELEGAVQVPVNPAAGLTFAAALRSFLRQDPDVIMVGEIRDLETAQIALQAALTGHLVLSTLHTHDAAAAVTRLLDMGVEPFLVASTLEAVLAQRLVRRICPHCSAPCEPAMALLEQLDLTAEKVGTRPFFRGHGCARCAHTGYLGRTGIFEWLGMTEELRELAAHQAPALLLRQKARALGMRTLREDGLRLVFNGATTLEEIARFT